MRLIQATLLLVFAVALIQAAPPTSHYDEAKEQQQGALAGRAHFKLPPLFDFQNFKRLFNKSYSGLLEELTRAKYFLSRAFRAFVSAVKYQHNQSPFYLAVNSMSDNSPQEFERMRNKQLEEWSRVASETSGAEKVTKRVVDSDSNLELPDFFPSDETNVAEELAKLVASHPNEPEFKELAGSDGKSTSGGRKKRSTTGSGGGSRKHLNMARLINTGKEVELASKAKSKIRARIPSDNPNYEPLDLPSFGLVDQQEKVAYWEIAPRVAGTSNLAGLVSSTLKGQTMLSATSEKFRFGGDPMDLDALWDEVFLDLRKTNCFFLPRQQGHCGSCYAFAMVSIMEWIHCMRHGELVAFSEQYFVDCGKGRVEGVNGCTGGTPIGSATFVHNFGLELRLNYPYRLQEDQCPYEETTDLKTTGYLRAPLGDMSTIVIELWPKYLPRGPLMVGISIGPGFFEYGGGVHGHGCDQQKAGHAVVVIGHGREDGREYWLIRNSHSIGWGEGGYYKLDKEANCVHPEVGFKFGSSDGLQFSFSPDVNQRNNQNTIKQHYARNMLNAKAIL